MDDTALHLALPMRLAPNGSLARNVQDSHADLTTAAVLCLRVARGSLPGLRELGTPDLTFEAVDHDVLQELRALVREVDPRIDLHGDEVLEQALRTIHLHYGDDQHG